MCCSSDQVLRGCGATRRFNVAQRGCLYIVLDARGTLLWLITLASPKLVLARSRCCPYFVLLLILGLIHGPSDDCHLEQVDPETDILIQVIFGMSG